MALNRDRGKNITTWFEMTDGKIWFIFGLISAVLVMYWYRKLCGDVHLSNRRPQDAPGECDLVIGVLSARDHFEQRQAIRDTWMKEADHTGDFRVEVWFVVGAYPCLVPPEDRDDPYSCHRWVLTLPESYENIPAVVPVPPDKQIQEDIQEVDTHTVCSSLTFQVKHSIELVRLGVYGGLLVDGQTVEVWLEDLHTQEEVVRVLYSPLDYGISHELYHYQSTEPFLLPKGFEGRVYFSCTSDLPKLKVTPPVTEVNTAGGVLHFDKLQDNCSGVWDDKAQSYMVSFMLSVHDRTALEKHVSTEESRLKQWLDEATLERQLLSEEMEKHKDIIVVNITDTYRQLAAKLLHFHHKIQLISKPQYVMKTDDDCYVNLRSVIEEIKQIQRTNKRNIWWSRFRDQWLVERHGKWREKTYTADVYPRFACGTGNVVSADVSQWLANNRHSLHQFQDERWQCDNTCEETALALSELEPEDIRQLWNNKRTCGNLCDCVKTSNDISPDL